MSLSKENKYPEIRFKGFTEAWEQRKFSDLIQTMRGGASIAPDDYKNNGVATVPKSAINSNGVADLSGSKYVSKEFFEKNKNSSVASDELVTSLRDLVPSAPNMGRIVKLDGKYQRYLMPQGVYNLILHNKVDEKFLISFSNTSKFRKIIFQEKNGSTQVHIRNSEYLGISINAPGYEEQSKIGTLFKKLDDTIALHQCKLDRLENLKKAYLQVLLPNIEEKTPKMRFTNFNESWEQRKLEDISTYIRGSFPQPYTNPKFYDEKDGKPFVQVADIGFDLKLNADTKAHISKLAEPKSRFVKAGKVIVALQGSIEKSIGRTAITQYDAYFDRTILIFEDYKIPVDKQYFAQVIKALFEREKERAWGATISTITKKHLNNFIIGVPSIEEQKQIGMFFKQLDNNIALHQEKLDKLFILKKAYLKMMFI